VAGALDGSHVLVSPPLADEAAYVNRHHSHLINVLCVAGPQRQILYINASQTGRNHDSRVLQESTLWETFETRGQLPFPGAVLLGDSAYPLKEWLITPFLGDPIDPGRQRFNLSHSRTRCLIEQTFGLLKNRFSCLKTGLRVKDMALAAKIIVACAVLHNLCIMHGEQGAEEANSAAPNRSVEEDGQGQDRRGERRRLQLLEHFQRNNEN